jgi:hypothetical protein
MDNVKRNPASSPTGCASALAVKDASKGIAGSVTIRIGTKLYHRLRYFDLGPSSVE